MAAQQVAASAAPHTVYVNDRQAIYDGSVDRTYVAFLGLERDLYVTYWDHSTEAAATPVEVGVYPISDDDNHGAPSIEIDLDGYLHVVWGSHNSTHRHSKSDSPHDISSWTTNTLTGSGTYSSINCDPATGDLYLLDRMGSLHGSSGTHEFGGMRVSDDGGATWSTVSPYADTTGTPEDSSDWYLFGSFFAPDGLLHLGWTVARGSGHLSNVRRNIYHAKFDPSDGHFYTASDIDLGTSIDWDSHPDCLAAERDAIGASTLAVASASKIAIGYTGANDINYAVVWDGITWRETPVFKHPQATAGFPAVWPVSNGWRAAFPALHGGLGDVELWGAPDSGSYWFRIGTVLEGSSGEGFARCAPVRGAGPFAALTMEEPSGFSTTSATGPDLLPLYAIEDDGALSLPGFPGEGVDVSAETDIAAIDDGGENTAAEVRTALSAVLVRGDAPLTRPETPHVDDQEFDGTVPTGTAVTPTGTVTWAEGNGVLSAVFDDQSANDICPRLWELTPSAAPVTIETGVLSLVTRRQNSSMAGLLFTDGTSTSSNAVALCVYMAAGGPILAALTGTLTNMSVSNLASDVHYAYPWQMRMRLVWTAANTWAWAISSFAGVSWTDFGMSTFASTLTPSHFGVFVSSWSASFPSVADFEFIRVTESDLSV